MYTGHWYGGRNSYLAECGEYALLPGWTFHRDLTTSAFFRTREQPWHVRCTAEIDNKRCSASVSVNCYRVLDTYRCQRGRSLAATLEALDVFLDIGVVREALREFMRKNRTIVYDAHSREEAFGAFDVWQFYALPPGSYVYRKLSDELWHSLESRGHTLSGGPLPKGWTPGG